MRIGRHLLRSTASNVAGQLVVLGVWFALTPFVVHRLGAAGYGLWVLVASLVAYGNLLDLGVGAAVTKYVAELRARGRPAEASDLVATALWMYCGVGVLVVAASVPFALAFPHVFHIAPGQRAEARDVVLLTALALAVKLPAATAYAVLRGLQRFGAINVISVSATLAQAAATVTVLLLGGGIVGLAALSAPLTLLTQIPMQIVIRRAAPDLKFGWRGARRSLLPAVASFSASLLVINSAGVVKTKTDEIVIAGALPVAAVAPYSIARRVAELPTLLTYQFVRTLFPLASELEGAGQASRLRSLYVSATRITLAIFVPVGIALMVLAGPFLTAWVGHRFAGDSDVAVILVGAATVDIAMWPAASLLQGTNGHRLLALFGGLSAALNLGLSIALVGGVGVTGVALGTLVAAALEAAVVVPFAMRRFRVRPAEMIRDALVPGLAPGLPALAALLVARAALHPASLAAVLLVGAIGGAVYLAGYLSFSASATERLALRHVLRATRPLARARG